MQQTARFAKMLVVVRLATMDIGLTKRPKLALPAQATVRPVEVLLNA